ncbi:hypothetical protein GUJ93_ZPchr0005g14355 [Zizania palustris]|uniref:Cysteine-rich transmembrane domain-containing protein n=1 Tax=Zizania palustris TaxID=103762 RepID=A0A8J5W119_ZIZPA|nr:hypothetical protein GUJ93_ZPchr0005g14355 [Zizania palustris]
MENNGKNNKLQPPPGYPRLDSEKANRKKKKAHCCGLSWRRSTKRGETSFIEGCIAALCCCWLCELCCD